MLTMTVEYEDYFGRPKKGELLFNLSKSELIEMVAKNEDIGDEMSRLVAHGTGKEIMVVFKDLIMQAYGERSEDGNHFLKSPEISERFIQSAAYDKLFMDLMTDPNKAAAFFKGIMPADLLESVKKMSNSNEEMPAKPRLTLEQIQKMTPADYDQYIKS